MAALTKAYYGSEQLKSIRDSKVISVALSTISQTGTEF